MGARFLYTCSAANLTHHMEDTPENREKLRRLIRQETAVEEVLLTNGVTMEIHRSMVMFWGESTPESRAADDARERILHAENPDPDEPWKTQR